MANAAYQRDGGMSGISTGLTDMDKKLGGLHKSDLLILAGRPSMGKTSLATNIAFNIAKAYRKGKLPDGSRRVRSTAALSGSFRLRCRPNNWLRVSCRKPSEVPSEQIRRGDMTEGEFRRFVEAAKTLEACPLFIDDTPALPISQLAARARRLKREHGLDCLIVDYLAACSPSDGQGQPGERGDRDYPRAEGDRQRAGYSGDRLVAAFACGGEPR